MSLTHPSPNFGERRGGQRPGLIVLHYTAMESCAAALERLCDPAAEVSAHYLIDRDGGLLHLVPEEARAWHAGEGEWAGRGDVNSRSIGIELVNGGREPFPEPQMARLERLLPGIMARWSISAKDVIAHADLAPARKADPGPRFDWRRLAMQGLSVWPEDRHPAQPCDFSANAARFGYPRAPEDAVLAAFRLRFRPWARGPLDAVDAGLAADLAQRFPVDGTAMGA
ncbi:MAG: N-acetylmuramoyl-L-alanine amidase [Tabrizicola sp.]|nr:N-acetylmuramoyl-L-alanine amidase [Tabrizicola sp.]